MIGIPLAPDNLVDSRLSSVVEKWGGVEVFYAASHSPALGRDKVVQHALYRIPKPSHILFIDSDVIVRPNTLKRLLSHNKDIVCGVAPLAIRGVLSWNCSRNPDKTSLFPVGVDELPNNLFKATKIGFGIVLVKTEVFDNLAWPFWEHEYCPGDILRGEDIYFGDKVIDAGYDIWVDPKVKCEHNRVVGLLSIINNLKGQKP